MRLLVRVAALLAVLLPAAASAQVPQTVLFPGLEGQALLDAVRAQYRPPATLGYDVARDSLFAREQRLYGALTCVYTGFSIVLTPGADPSTDAFAQGINTEHTYPQSMGAIVEPSKSDLHHLYPVRDNVNSARNNHPYGEIPDDQTDGWYRLDASQSTVPAVAIDEWSELDNTNPNPLFRARFEPREDHAGNAARAVFYYRTMYPERVAAAGSDEFFETQRTTLLQWARQDAVDAREAARSTWIASKQGTQNPFVLDSTLARRAFQNRVDAGGGAPPAYSSVVFLNEIHYEQTGTDTGEFVEVAVPTGVDPASVTLTLYNGNGGVLYGTEATVATFVPGATAGGYRLYTLTFPANGLQNGAPDGLALSIDGEIAQFLSYEGTFDGTAGIATSRTSLDIGVNELDTTPVGFSLQLRGSGNAYTDFAWAAPSASSLGQVNTGQTFTAVSSEPAASTSGALALRLVGPNPVRSVTAVAVSAPALAEARVEVFDTVGRRVATLFQGTLAAGERQFVLDASGLAPGVYVVRAVVGAEASTLRVVVTR
ncbi:MAG TPA: endonuclease [Rubricoccaceae bacterium]